MAGSRFDSPFTGGTTWDVAGHTVVGVIEPAMIPVLRRGSESVIDTATDRITGYEWGDALGPWDGFELRDPLVWRASQRSLIDALREGVAEVDAELTRCIRDTHTAFLGELPVLGGLVQLGTAEQVEVWLHALYDHHLLACEIVGKPETEPTLALWCHHTMTKINEAAEKARPPRR
ncbi:hypothetical protein HFP15_18800 [Amycolatopsis sp. K13G38]|uniref:Uncharacterized protein n=1 Tax=Amycolatopsis acididurans TaxID=2724524 RepID=A0ABX1J569_9PSEU|nr:hypothetical protein [Amycolatopsis acididurans]NKQ54936.1 hypothetical protein [Amycolatopsis acididurans]